MEEIKRMDIKEFRELGFLQEVNRQFFHPLGLALEVVIKSETMPNVADSGEMLIGGVWDYRKDPEGIMFGKGIIEKEKVLYVDKLKQSKIQKRKKLGCLDNGVQPAG